MSELRVTKMILPSAEFNGVSSLPSISENLRLSSLKDVFKLGESDGLYINYGKVDYAFPYKVQDNYGRELKEKEQVTVELENEHLKAVFLPYFGGKLYSLYDKDAGKDLLFVNDVVRPCHLGIRNAWMSGGVEWNFGYVGHNPFTCDLMHTALTKLDDGTPVLRFYQYERVRNAVYQMDFFLPDGSHFLYARIKLINPNFEVVPVYWWSNIAVPDNKGDRVVVPADSSFTQRDGYPVKIAIPEFNGIDVSYPSNNPIAIDFFWNLPDKERKYICHVDSDGYGLVQTSTRRLKGRKLFVWGASAGGDRWKNFLAADDKSGSYSEIQAGIAQTQYECLPMPPKTVWEWVEAYGAIQTDRQKIHSDWSSAKAEAEYKLDKLVTEPELEGLLESTRKMSKTRAEKVLFYSDGWGALEQRRREISGEDPLCDYLDFGKLSDEQAPFVSLLEGKTVGEHDTDVPPVSYIYGKEWVSLIKEAISGKDKDNWFAYLQLGLNEFISKDFERAETAFNKSIAAKESPWAYFCLAILKRDTGKHHDESEYMLKAYKMLPRDVSLAKATFRCLYENGLYENIKDLYESADETVRQIPRCMIYYAFTLVSCGDVSGAESILNKNGGLIIPDIRECETITLDLWYAIEEAKAKKAGKVFDKSSAVPPKFVDFRMFASVEWLNGGDIIE